MIRPRILALEIVGIVVLLGLATFALPVRTQSLYVCELTGSVKQSNWCFGAPLGETYEPSDLEQFIARTYPARLQHKWVWISETRRDLFGRPLAFSDSARPTYALVALCWSSAFAELTNDEKLKLYELLGWASATLSDNAKSRMYDSLTDAADADALRRIMAEYGEQQPP